MKTKTLCKISKEIDIKDYLELTSSLVFQPKYICGKCGRSSNQEKFLCEPNEIIPPTEELEQLDFKDKLSLFEKKPEKKDKHKEEKKDKHKDKDKHKEKKEKKEKKSEEEE